MMIFFDSGGTEIRREWEPVLDEAAKAAAAGTRLRVTGHTDRPGSDAVNRADEGAASTTDHAITNFATHGMWG